MSSVSSVHTDTSSESANPLPSYISSPPVSPCRKRCKGAAGGLLEGVCLAADALACRVKDNAMRVHAMVAPPLTDAANALRCLHEGINSHCRAMDARICPSFAESDGQECLLCLMTAG